MTSHDPPHFYPAVAEIEFQAMQWFISFSQDDRVLGENQGTPWQRVRMPGDLSYVQDMASGPWRQQHQPRAYAITDPRSTWDATPPFPFTAVACLRLLGLDWRSFRLESLPLIGCLSTAGARQSCDRLCKSVRGC